MKYLKYLLLVLPCIILYILFKKENFKEIKEKLELEEMGIGA